MMTKGIAFAGCFLLPLETLLVPVVAMSLLLCGAPLGHPSSRGWPLEANKHRRHQAQATQVH